MVILGGGLSGATAAIAARLQGSPVTLVEKSVFPRHKVCGEFLSPEVLPLLAQMGLEAKFAAENPAPMRRVVLNFGGREKRFPLPETAYGLSRYKLDAMLFQRAQELGVVTTRETEASPTIVATGRGALPGGSGEKGQRLFGFKAHFRGTVNDAVELYFIPGGYVGVNPVEGGITNVCGLCSESALRKLDFNVDNLISENPALRNRLQPMERLWDWLFVGPLVFTNRFKTKPNAFYTGDAVSFVDPFTGSGMLAALHSGWLAGSMAAQGASPEAYHLAVREALGRPFAVSSLLRSIIWTPWAVKLAPLAPGRVLFWLTRPRKVARK